MARCTRCNQYVRGLDGVCNECTGVVRSVPTVAVPVEIPPQENLSVPERLPTQAKLLPQVKLPTVEKPPNRDKLPPQPPTPEVLPQPISRVSPATVSAITKRYSDAYAIAQIIEYAGIAIKIFGLIIAGLIAISGFTTIGDFARAGAAAGIGIIVITGGIAIFWAILFYIIGTLVSAKAQMLKASLDTAVNSSPFLNDRHKLAIMALPELD